MNAIVTHKSTNLAINYVLELLLAIFLVSPACADETIDPARAANHLVNSIYADVADKLANQLAGSGLAKTDIDTTVDSIVKAYGKCVVAGLVASGNPLAKEMLIVLSNGQNFNEVDGKFENHSKEELEIMFLELQEMVDTCKHSVNQEYGIVEQDR